MKSLETVIEQLSEPVSMEQAAAPGGLPYQPGLYLWWVRQPDALPPFPLAPQANGFCPLYLGLAPSAKVSKETLRSRVAKKHIRGSVANSTFRRILVALLWPSQGWTPVATDKLVTLSRQDNEALTRWMKANLLVAWSNMPDPWAVQAGVLARLKPTLNQAQKPRHPLFPLLREAQTNLELAAPIS